MSLPLLCLMGPTGTGKSAIGMDLAQRLGGEIISVDSAMIYRGMDIGTAKPGRGDRARIRHHLIDIRDPVERYSAGEFTTDARRVITEIRARGKVPILVGGTFLYFRALLKGLSRLPDANLTVRAAIRARAERRGWGSLHADLARLDPQSAARIHVNDRQRIERALELYWLTGLSPSQLYARDGRRETANYDALRYALWPVDREMYTRRLETRFHAMLAAGLVDEVRYLHVQAGLTPDCPAARAVGYRQLGAWLGGKYDFEEAVRRAVVATRRYAKRQLTWLRGEPGLIRIPMASTAMEQILHHWRSVIR